MSGGHFNYLGAQIQDALEAIGQDEEVRRRFPYLSQLLIGLAPILSTIEHDIDWDLSSDTKIPNDLAFERSTLMQVLEVAMKAGVRIGADLRDLIEPP